jgi:hypothetical protein
MMRPIRFASLSLLVVFLAIPVVAEARGENVGTTDQLILGPPWRAESDQANALFGTSVATAGDVNRDGFDDVIVGAEGYSNGQASEGRAFAYHGSAAGLSATPNWTAESNQAGAQFGRSVASAGDVNGDGYDDVIVGAWSYDNGQQHEGRAFAYHGSAAGLSATPNWTAESNQHSALFGLSVAGAGDVNGDGYDDAIVGALQYDNGQNTEGRAYAYYGSAAGLSMTPNWIAESNQVRAYFGTSVAGAGDVNRDGFDDVIVGAEGYSNGQAMEGRAFAYHGAAAGLSATPNWTAESNQAGAQFGRSVASAGDVNGDGYDDVIVGATFFDHGQTDEGRTFAYHGSGDGLSTTSNWTAESNQASAWFGAAVAGVGDVTGDGYSDVIVGGPYLDHGQTDEGVALIYFGAAAGLGSSPSRRAEPDQDFANFGTSVGTAGDVNGLGVASTIMGAPFFDHGQTDEGVAFVYRSGV